MGFGGTARELSGPDVVIGAQRAAKSPCDAAASVVVSLLVISALPVSGNQDKGKLSLRSPGHHLSVDLARTFSGVPAQLPSLRPDTAVWRSWQCDDATGLLALSVGRG